MLYRRQIFLSLSLLLIFSAVGCTIEGNVAIASSTTPMSRPGIEITPSMTSFISTNTPLPETNTPVPTELRTSPTPTPSSTRTETQFPTETAIVFDIGEEITINYLRNLEITGSEIKFEEQLIDRSNYHQHLVSYVSEGNKIYGLLTIPFVDPPDEGFKAIVFNHGYIPPAAYRTTERYTAYVDYLARNGFVVFKIDYRGHGISQGQPTGSYFSPGYTIDSITALKSLQMLDFIDSEGIGMWGHSMAGNLVLRAMLVESDIQAGVIWAGAVYSYDDFAKYGIDDNTYRPPATPEAGDESNPRRRSREIIEAYGWPDSSVDYWKAVSLTENIEFLNQPIQIHHAEDDFVVNIGYSFDLAAVLQQNTKEYELYLYEGGGHNLISPYFEQAMTRTVEFFKKNL
jgi:dipeptidyl aminopeptidase/acylaminoacyl peptidase